MQSKAKVYLRIIVSMIVFLGAMAFFMRRDPNMPWIIGIVVFVSLSLYVIFASPRATDFINRYPRHLAAGGVLIIVATFAAIIALFVLFPNMPTDDSYLTGSFMAAMFLGCMLVTLPRSVRRSAEIRSSQTDKTEEVPKRVLEIPKDKDHPYQFVLDHTGGFFRIVAPWALFFSALPLIVLQAMALKERAIENFFQPFQGRLSDATAIAILFAVAFANFSAIPISTLYWQRFVLGYRAPKGAFLIPSRSTLKYFFILWIGGSVVSTFNKMIAPDVVEFAKMTLYLPENIVKEGTLLAIWSAAIWLFAPMALLLPASAVGDKSADLYSVSRLAQPLGTRFRNSLVLTIMPAVLLSALLENAIENMNSLSLSGQQILSVGPALIYFLGLTAAATYLAQIYQTSVRAYPGVHSSTM